MVKKTRFTEYDSSRRDGLIAINLKDDDELVRVVQTSGGDDIFMVSSAGTTIRFFEDDVRGHRPLGHGRDRHAPAPGRRSGLVRRGPVTTSTLLIITDTGYGKAQQAHPFPSQGPGATMGVIGIRLARNRGSVVGALMVGLDDELLLISSAGVTIRRPRARRVLPRAATPPVCGS